MYTTGEVPDQVEDDSRNGHDGKVQEPLDVGTTVEDPPTELDGDEIARTSPMP